MARLRLGTRASALAVRQCELLAEEMRALDPGLEIELVKVRTQGDRVQDRPLHEIGGKGVFLKEIEEALLDGRVDVGVHSMKDVPATLPDGLCLGPVPRRADPRDVLVWAGDGGLEALPRGARIGTGSLRRAALIRDARPDVAVEGLRGNVGTRLEKWRRGDFDGVVLAAAGVSRLDLDLPEARRLDPATFVPSIGQGALGLEMREDGPWLDRLAALGDEDSRVAVMAEREVLRRVSGDCTTPIAGHAVVENGRIVLRAFLALPDASRSVRREGAGRVADWEQVGRAVADEILDGGGREILEELEG